MAESHVDFMRRWFADVWDAGSWDAIEAMLAPTGRLHGLGQPDQVVVGPAAFRPFWEQFCAAFPERTFAVEEGLELGDRVAVRWRAELFHGTDALGSPATHKWIPVTGIAFACVRDGQLHEGWNNWDSLELARQIDALAPVKPFVPR